MTVAFLANSSQSESLMNTGDLPGSPTAEDEAATRRIMELPKDLGVMLISVGGLGLVIPGMVGVPALLAGGLVLWPKGFRRAEDWLRRRSPCVHRNGMRQIGRFLDDLERRYPNSSGAKIAKKD